MPVKFRIQEPEIDMDLTGTLSLQAGEDFKKSGVPHRNYYVTQGSSSRKITCTVIFPSPNGIMKWMIGDEEQTNDNPIEEADDGNWEQSFNLVSTVGMDGKQLRCL